MYSHNLYHIWIYKFPYSLIFKGNSLIYIWSHLMKLPIAKRLQLLLLGLDNKKMYTNIKCSFYYYSLKIPFISPFAIKFVIFFSTHCQQSVERPYYKGIYFYVPLNILNRIVETVPWHLSKVCFGILNILRRL